MPTARSEEFDDALDLGGWSVMGTPRRPRRRAGGAKRTSPKKGAETATARTSASARGSGRGEGAASSRKPVLDTRTEVSAGGVVYRRRDDGKVETLLAARRTRRGDIAWGLAKGGIEEGETIEDAAVREVREETGIDAVIEESLGDTRYFYIWEEVRIRKTVHFFLMRAIGGDVDDRDDEMEEVRWFPLSRALKRAAYRGERDVLQRAAAKLR
jgi:8-oxo-dGTP pyrophosphatase MutT (NUDIX family)